MGIQLCAMKLDALLDKYYDMYCNKIMWKSIVFTTDYMKEQSSKNWKDMTWIFQIILTQLRS